MFQQIFRQLTWQRVPAKMLHFRAHSRETRFLILYAVFYCLVGFVIGWLIQHYPLPLLGATQFNQDFWYSIVFKVTLLLLVPGIVFFIVWRYQWKDLSLGLTFQFRSLLGWIALPVIGFFLNATHLKLISDILSKYPDASLRIALGVILPLFTAALPEELFFRGFLQTRLEKSNGRIIACLASTLLFTAWHLPSRYLLSTGVEGQAGHWDQVLLNTGVPVFVIGFLFALHWSRYRNIVLLILTHWAIDILPAVSSFLKIAF